MAFIKLTNRVPNGTKLEMAQCRQLSLSVSFLLVVYVLLCVDLDYCDWLFGPRNRVLPAP